MNHHKPITTSSSSKVLPIRYWRRSIRNGRGRTAGPERTNSHEHQNRGHNLLDLNSNLLQLQLRLLRLHKSVTVQGRKLVGSEKDFPLLGPSASVADGFEHRAFALQTQNLVSVSAAEGEGGVPNKCAHDGLKYSYSHTHIQALILKVERKHRHGF